MFSEKCLLVARQPTEDLGAFFPLLHKIVNVEIDPQVRLLLARVHPHPADMSYAMMLIYG